MAQRIKRLIQTGEFVPMKQENLEPVIHGEIFVIKTFIKELVPKTRKFKVFVHSEEFISDRGSPKEHFSRKLKKNIDLY